MHPAALRDERGHTLIEVLVTLMLGLLITFSTLTVFEAFDRGVAANSRLTDAEDSSRRYVANMVRVLRDAGAPSPVSGNSPTTVTRATANDLVFLSTSWPGESATGSSGTHVQRLCLDEATQTVWFDGLRFGTTGPADPGAACPSTATGWTHSAMARKVDNTAALPIFRLGSTTPVRSVGVQLRTDSGTAVSDRSLSLSSGGALRGALAPQVTASGVTYECNSDGSGKPLLSLTAGTGLKLAAAGGLAVGPGQVLLNVAAHTTQTVTLTITNAAGLQTLVTKEVSCP